MGKPIQEVTKCIVCRKREVYPGMPCENCGTIWNNGVWQAPAVTQALYNVDRYGKFRTQELCVGCGTYGWVEGFLMDYVDQLLKGPYCPDCKTMVTNTDRKRYFAVEPLYETNICRISPQIP